MRLAPFTDGASLSIPTSRWGTSASLAGMGRHQRLCDPRGEVVKPAYEPLYTPCARSVVRLSVDNPRKAARRLVSAYAPTRACPGLTSRPTPRPVGRGSG